MLTSPSYRMTSELVGKQRRRSQSADHAAFLQTVSWDLPRPPGQLRPPGRLDHDSRLVLRPLLSVGTTSSPLPRIETKNIYILAKYL
jgi:hypothetical protein